MQYGASAAYLPEGHQFAAEFSETDFVRLDIVDPSPPDYYALLDLSPTATREEIESAFRRHVVAVHPDRFFGDPVRYAESIVRLKELNEAMAVLRDPFTRSLYDIKYRSYQAASSPRRSGLLGRMAAS